MVWVCLSGARTTYNQTDEIIVELLRIAPRRKMELEQEVPASNVYHRCLRLKASGRIIAMRRPEHKETIYALSEAERKKSADVGTSANVVSQDAVSSRRERFQ